MLIKFLDGTSREIANLSRANLSRANLIGANLSGANLISASLSGASLSGANLIGANLSGANLISANLISASLSGANLIGANLYDANLISANLSRANLSGANLSGANLISANLYDANLSGANLIGANLYRAKGLEQFTIAGEGTLIVYKKLQEEIIATLRIPEAAARINAYGSRKCRAEYAEVIALSDRRTVGIAKYDNCHTRYVVGETVRPDSFDYDKRVECSHGIHFFITKTEAENY